MYKNHTITADMPLDEKMFYAERLMPKMYSGSYAIIPLMLTLPIFSVAREGASHIDAVWTRKGVGSVRYTGPQLSQSHLTVLLGLAHMRRGDVVDNVIAFRPTTFLASIGWSDNERNIARLKELLDDLYAGRMRVWGIDEVEADAARVSIISEWKPSLDSGEWHVYLSPTVLRLFNGHLTRLNTAKRQQLREGLATFLFGYISANSCDLAFSYEELHKASGSEAAVMKRFGEEVRSHLTKFKALGIIKNFEQVRGGVKVWKN